MAGLRHPHAETVCGLLVAHKATSRGAVRSPHLRMVASGLRGMLRTETAVIGAAPRNELQTLARAIDLSTFRDPAAALVSRRHLAPRRARRDASGRSGNAGFRKLGNRVVDAGRVRDRRGSPDERVGDAVSPPG